MTKEPTSVGWDGVSKGSFAVDKFPVGKTILKFSEVVDVQEYAWDGQAKVLLVMKDGKKFPISKKRFAEVKALREKGRDSAIILREGTDINTSYKVLDPDLFK
jgi:hypothetical protein